MQPTSWYWPIWDRLVYTVGRLGEPKILPRMSAPNEQVWLTPENHGQLGMVMAEWLEGNIASQIGYAPNSGPAPETHDLVPTLSRLNRAGFVTQGSQPGCGPTRWRGGDFWQRAFVDGFCEEELIPFLMAGIRDTPGLNLIVHEIPEGSGELYGGRSCPWHSPDDAERDAVPVTSWSPSRRKLDFPLFDVTWSGVRPNHADVFEMTRGITLRMLDVLVTGRWVTVYDEKWGRNEPLWSALDRSMNAWDLRQRGYINSTEDVVTEVP